jgi:hypothetical protein
LQRRNPKTALAISYAVKAFLLPLTVFYILSGILGCAQFGQRLETLQMLRRLSRNGEMKQQALNQETKNFLRIKNYIDTNKLKRGTSAKVIIKQCGEPVAILIEPEGERWAYKRRNVDWVSGEKIYLFFDIRNTLADWECVNCS